MHRLIKIRIIRDFDHLEEQMRRGFDTLLEAYQTPVSFRPAADFYETAQGLVLRLELAGVASEDVSLTLTGHELLVRGRRRLGHDWDGRQRRRRGASPYREARGNGKKGTAEGLK